MFHYHVLGFWIGVLPEESFSVPTWITACVFITDSFYCQRLFLCQSSALPAEEDCRTNPQFQLLQSPPPTILSLTPQRLLRSSSLTAATKW
ncbi:hypothetical protein ILYODFUR_034697 [Ilyodon furcidens]|uniref:Secreted protein n=1 Tax=Ilyodon furcidens TaxID=33524 RepID=A0ABV0TPC4_9TELE